MIQIETNITDRKLKFIEFETSKNWIKDFPNDNWCLIVIVEVYKPMYFDEILRKSTERNVGYICAIGKQHELIHKMADEEIEFREVDIEEHYLPKHHRMTVGDENFGEGMWSGLNLTFNDETDINEIIIIDLTKEAFKKTVDLIKKFEKGYLPPD